MAKAAVSTAATHGRPVRLGRSSHRLTSNWATAPYYQVGLWLAHPALASQGRGIAQPLPTGYPAVLGTPSL
ncbi:hypothetical protein BDW75DRAFT_213236 [Aspergillus navahoensis]